MNNKKLSMDELKKICSDWAEVINDNYSPDFIIFIAKSGFIIAKQFSEYFKVPMQEIIAHRQGGKLRKIFAKIFSKFPLSLRNAIVGNPLMYKMNGKNGKRNIIIPDKLKDISENNNYKKILLIDDSIDTGWTFKGVYSSISILFPNSEIKTLALIRMHYALERFDVDFALFEDTLLLTPAQVDHEEHTKFINEYKNWKANA